MFKRIVLGLLAIALLAALIAYSQYRPQRDHVSGFIEADEIRLGSRVGGRVQQVLVEEGQQVKAGQVLVELEPYDLLARETEAVQTLAARDAEFRLIEAGRRPEEVAQAKARLDQLQARLDLLVAGPRDQEVRAAKGRLQVAEAEQRLARSIFQRQKQLLETMAITPEELDRATEALQAAQAMVSVRTQELDILDVGTREEEKREARAKVEEAAQAWKMAEKGSRQEEIDQAKAARDAAQAALEAVRQQISELKISSPVDGRVEALELQKGDLVSPGAPVLSVLDHQHLWVRAYVPQNRIALTTGQKLWVTVDSYPDDRFQGEITFISRQAEFTPSNVQTPEERAKQVFRVKVTLHEGLEKLWPGMTADVLLDPIGEPQ